jgi:FkbM family methyltransferase
MREFARRLLRRTGFEVCGYNYLRIHELRKGRLLRDKGVSLVFDVGANVGQFGKRLRALGYGGRIVSFEPIREVYSVLQTCAAADARWETVNVALGERDGEAEFNVAEISEVSSFLTATGASTTQGWTRTTRQTVKLRRLDSLSPEYIKPGDRIYLKLDTQGYEREVLLGAGATLARVVALELEVSTIPLYKDEWLMPEMMYALGQRGFGVFSIDTVTVDHVTGRVIQYEVLFTNDSPAVGLEGDFPD